MRLHPHAAGLVAILDPDWRRKLRRGGLVLLIPFLGWPAVLGYRTAFVRHLFSDTAAPLPDWDEGVLGHAVTGFKAMTVIFGYLLPLYLAIGVVVAARGFVPGVGTIAVSAFFVALPIFSTLSFPTTCIALASGPAAWLTTTECLAGLASFALLVFLLPAGFLQVSLTGRYASAFAFWRTIPFAVRNLPEYLEAWWHSSLMSLAGHLTLPLAPWGVVWCYLGIVMLFNEVLQRSGSAPPGGWLARALADSRLQGHARAGRFEQRDARGEIVSVLDLGAFSAPLPRALTRRVS